LHYHGGIQNTGAFVETKLLLATRNEWERKRRKRAASNEKIEERKKCARRLLGGWFTPHNGGAVIGLKYVDQPIER
jgi:hypothetical protein